MCQLPPAIYVQVCTPGIDSVHDRACKSHYRRTLCIWFSVFCGGRNLDLESYPASCRYHPRDAMHIFCQPFFYTLHDRWLELRPSSRQCPDASRTNCCWWSVDTANISIELCAWTLTPSPKFSPSCWDGRPLQQNWPSLRHSPACVHKEAHEQSVEPRLRISAFANLSGCQLLRSQLPTSPLTIGCRSRQLPRPHRSQHPSNPNCARPQSALFWFAIASHKIHPHHLHASLL